MLTRSYLWYGRNTSNYGVCCLVCYITVMDCWPVPSLEMVTMITWSYWCLLGFCTAKFTLFLFEINFFCWRVILRVDHYSVSIVLVPIGLHLHWITPASFSYNYNGNFFFPHLFYIITWYFTMRKRFFFFLPTSVSTDSYSVGCI